MFNQDDDDSSDGAKKRKLVPLDYDDDKSDKKPTTAEEKRARIKHLIESIPTAKDELFAYPLDWNIVDQVRTNSTCLIFMIPILGISTLPVFDLTASPTV